MEKYILNIWIMKKRLIFAMFVLEVMTDIFVKFCFVILKESNFETWENIFSYFTQRLFSSWDIQILEFPNLKHALSGLRQFLAAEGPKKWWKIIFNITVKSLFALKIFKFLPFFWSCRKAAYKKFRIISKFMKWWTRKQIIAIPILPKISQEVKAIRQLNLVI